MAKPIEQIEQDLTKLCTASSQMGIELATAYKSYFETLAPTLKQQSIQGCYYLCTSAYTESFLRLSYNQRSQLLKTLQRVIKNVVADLVTKIEPSSRHNNADDELTGDLTAMVAAPIDWFATPESLSTWQKNLELEISQSLKEISYKVNLLLQQGQVMPPSIPKPILEANPQADERGGNTTNIPNILSVLIEQNVNKDDQLNSENEDEDEDNLPNIVQIHSLYLRLTEIEFSNIAVLTSRKNINQLANKIKILRREYRQKQQERKIAEAESAWRNSWFED